MFGGKKTQNLINPTRSPNPGLDQDLGEEPGFKAGLKQSQGESTWISGWLLFKRAGATINQTLF